MSEDKNKKDDHDLRPEYDFSEGVKGKYSSRYAEGTNIVVLDPDVAEEFRTSEAVNKALRELAEKKRASG